MWFKKYNYCEEAQEGTDLPGGETTDLDPPSDPPAGDPPTDPPAGDPPPIIEAGDPPPPADWPDDWRVKMDKEGKNAKTLERFASPNALLDSYLALRQKVDSGELKAVAPYPDKGKPEDQAKWRKDHGIPETADGYTPKFKDGLVIGEDDKPFVDDFLKAAHATNATPEQVNGLLHWYYGSQENAVKALEEKDVAYLHQTEDTLHQEWGGEYRTNVNTIKGLIDTMPESVKEPFANARLADGNPLMSNPDMARWLVHIARTVNPVSTVVPGAGANMANAIEDEIATIENVMKTDRKTYNGNEKMQNRLRELYGARERAK